MKRQVKEVCKALLRRFGYEVRRVPISAMPEVVAPEEVAAQTGKDAAYYTEYSTPWPVFAPWVGDPDFQRLYEGVAPLTLGTPERSYALLSLAQMRNISLGTSPNVGSIEAGRH
jgi:hypothetical protein